MGIEIDDICLLGMVTLVACYQLATFAIRVGASRRKFKINPPKMEGDPEFIRTLRAQQNSLEFFPIFMGCLWVSGIFFHQIPAAVLGMYYIYCRQDYFNGYIRHSEDRLPGFRNAVRCLKAYLGVAALGLLQCIVQCYVGFNIAGMAWHYVRGVTGAV